MFESAFRKVTLKKRQSYDKFNLFRIMTVKSTINRWCDKFKDAISGNIETA